MHVDKVLMCLDNRPFPTLYTDNIGDETYEECSYTRCIGCGMPIGIGCTTTQVLLWGTRPRT